MAVGSGKIHVVRVNKAGYVDKQGRERDYSSAYLRRTYRDGGKVKNKTVANLSALPGQVSLNRSGFASAESRSSASAPPSLRTAIRSWPRPGETS